MSTKTDIVDEMSIWFTLVNKGLEPETVKFYQQLSDINSKPSSLYYLIEAAEGFKEYLDQEPEFYNRKEAKFFLQ